MSEDFRKRKIESPGFIPEKICTIRQYRGKQKKQIRGKANGVLEIIGDIRIDWNSRSGYPRIKKSDPPISDLVHLPGESPF